MINNLIGISGRINSGKDTVGKILQALAYKGSENFKLTPEEQIKGTVYLNHSYQIKKFADKTTEAFELITGVNYHKLSREDKEVVRPQYVEFAEKQKEIFDEDVWINALFDDYRIIGDKSYDDKFLPVYPNWIITDVRFPNEDQAIKDRGGIVIRVNKDKFSYQSDLPETASPIEHAERGKELHYHSSETALDDHEFDYVIENNDSIEELVEKVKQLNLV